MEYMESKMQDYMESAEHEYNYYSELLNPPIDWQSPEWDKEDKVHNWRNYASTELKGLWCEMSGKQRMIIAANLNDIASQEDWD